MFKLIGILLGLFLLGAAGSGAYSLYQIAAPLKVTGAEREFVIAAGQTAKQVAAALAERGMIRSHYWFRVYVWLRRAEGRFLAGTYNLPESFSSADLVNLFTQAAERPARRAQILEGWSIKDTDAYLAESGWYPAGAYAAAAGEKEGYLFPDTYQIFTDAPIEDLIRKQEANFTAKITAEMRSAIEQKGRSFDAVIIMASIIEAEVPHEADRPVVADIFWSRLDAGVALQSDATLKYIIGGQRPALTEAELKMDSPYNSYKYRGLPPTPIGNPGLTAIRAAIYPAQTDYFYFLSTPDGETIFSRSLTEHNAAKAKYLR